jgi:hypothetical protein
VLALGRLDDDCVRLDRIETFETLPAFGALLKSQPQSSGAKALADQARPMMDAVAISSSSSASDTLPETE